MNNYTYRTKTEVEEKFEKDLEEKLAKIREKFKAKKQLAGFSGQTPEEPKTVEKVIEITPDGNVVEQIPVHPQNLPGYSEKLEKIREKIRAKETKTVSESTSSPFSTKQFDLFDPETKGKITLEATESGEEWMALCPKHDDTSPSLSINPKKGLYYCHGCEFKGSL